MNKEQEISPELQRSARLHNSIQQDPEYKEAWATFNASARTPADFVILRGSIRIVEDRFLRIN